MIEHQPKITYIGHATTLIETGGLRLLTDPVLRNWVWHLHRGQTTVEADWYQKIDAVLISHLHWDHLDLPSLKLLERNTRLIVPRGAGLYMAQQGFTNIEELGVDQSITLGQTDIRATYAHHDGARSPFSGLAADSLGYLIRNRHTIYFAGDTDLFPEMTGLTNNRLDVALLPVWGWGPTLGHGHMDPYQAARALQLLRPKVAIPIHWGTFFPFGLRWLMPQFLTNPPKQFEQYATRLAVGVQTKIVEPGQSLIVV